VDRAPVLSLQGVAKTYPSGTHALAPNDLTLHAGEFLTLLGPSGCGKSTLLHIVAGLASASGGDVRWWGGNFSATGSNGRRIGYVFQSPTLMPWARVEDNVRLPLDLAGAPRPEARRAVGEALELVGLSEFARHYPRELSGGMQMRVSIARALVTQPDLLLMDEPFGALDDFTRQRLDSELLSLWSARRFSVVFVTHNIYEAVFLSTRVAVMAARPGRILADVAIEEPHPRGEAFRVSTLFAGYCQQLTGLVAAAGAGEIR
jgi:NitT/TauT family transport system ATP-binding protein